MPEKQITMEERTGLRSLELLFRPVFDWELQARNFFQTQLRINGANLGLLMPEVYSPVAERTDQCCQLARWAVENGCESVRSFHDRGVEFEWVSIYTPLRLLRQADFPEFLQNTVKTLGVSPAQICLEAPPALLFPHETEVDQALRRIRENGFPILLTGVGREDCPLMRLAQQEADWFMLDSSVSSAVERREPSALALLDFLSEWKQRVIVDGIEKKETAEFFAEKGFLQFSGAAFGGYLKQRGVHV